MAVIQIKGAQIADSAISTDKLAGSIPDSKLAQLSTANKVALSAIDLDGATDIGDALADADLIFVDDGAGGTNKKAALSRLPTYLFAKVSGDATIASNGALTIASGAVETAMLADNAVTAAKLGATMKQKLHTVSGGSETTLDLDEALDASHSKPIVYKNGLALIPADSPSTSDEYSVSIDGGGSGNARITFGAALSVGDIVLVLYIG